MARLFGFEEEVAAWDGGHASGLMVYIFSASDLVVEFPLHSVCVVGLGACATPDAANSNTEGMLSLRSVDWQLQPRASETYLPGPIKVSLAVAL